ncbi:hypothetical protein MIND_00274200 [Mycena indigotica]|uniref:Uncharacterized protein n=1 Tax=Mycena indigotica TaxID=2126181 RepID=A0A8H6WDK9_9AGAR|nr:uncharacterized protein MIND_00274200 [Mycena indigotica]KAF7312601.1 hypothetical protein MIND_00274200 [Mycena indigotica]
MLLNGFPRRSKKRKKLASTTADLLKTSLMALKESSDAFPPLKSAVGAVLVVCDLAERTKQAFQIQSSGRSFAHHGDSGAGSGCPARSNPDSSAIVAQPRAFYEDAGVHSQPYARDQRHAGAFAPDNVALNIY